MAASPLRFQHALAQQQDAPLPSTAAPPAAAAAKPSQRYNVEIVTGNVRGAGSPTPAIIQLVGEGTCRAQRGTPRACTGRRAACACVRRAWGPRTRTARVGGTPRRSACSGRSRARPSPCSPNPSRTEITPPPPPTHARGLAEGESDPYLIGSDGEQSGFDESSQKTYIIHSPSLGQLRQVLVRQLPPEDDTRKHGAARSGGLVSGALDGRSPQGGGRGLPAPDRGQTRVGGGGASGACWMEGVRGAPPLPLPVPPPWL